MYSLEFGSEPAGCAACPSMLAHLRSYLRQRRLHRDVPFQQRACLRWLQESKRALRWLQPGLVVKRWVLTSSVGLLLLSLGLAIWGNLQPIYAALSFIEWALAELTDVLPYRLMGPLLMLAGFALVFLGQSRTFRSITKALAPRQGHNLVDALVQQRRLNRGPCIVCIGGGTGLATLLSGLKRYSSNLTAIVTVADDGGSSGRLREELGTLPPGDIRNCLTALAKEEELLTRLFRYRFEAGEGLEGHSFGNLFLTAMGGVTGDLESAVQASSQVLAIQGEVVPVTNADVRLWADLKDGRRVEGESAIGHVDVPIRHIGCIPANPPALPRALDAIAAADLILLGPGSLYTSLLPNLLVPDLVESIARSRAARLYICNLMTQKGESDGLDVLGHVEAIEQQLKLMGCKPRLFNNVLAQQGIPSREVLLAYEREGASPVLCDAEALHRRGYGVEQASMHGPKQRDGKYLRHDPRALALAIMRFYRRQQRSSGRGDSAA